MTILYSTLFSTPPDARPDTDDNNDASVRGGKSKGGKWTALVCLFIIVSTLFVYRNIRHYKFVSFDDDIYVTKNQHVQQGLSLDNIIWAFGTSASKDRVYWHPLTWLSHMLDWQLFGKNAGADHLENLFIHIINALLLFIVLRQMTGALWKSAFVAAIFALHPLNVNSVAWIAERKNVLSTLFWMLTMLAYVRYAKRPSVSKYLAVFTAMAFGLMAKPMLVTLPCVLLLMDFWPLSRFTFIKQENPHPLIFNKQSPTRLVLEKIPLLVLSFIAIGLSVISLHNNSQIVPHNIVPMSLRLENSLVSYINYIIKIIWPHNLTVYYPFPAFLPLWKAIGSAVIISGLSILFMRSAKKAPYLIIGWLWYLGTLLPVIGIIQGGRWPAMADRWAYVPEIGLFIMISWGVGAVIKNRHSLRMIAAGITAAIILSFMYISNRQVAYWKNSVTLFEHAVSISPKDYLMEYNLGSALTKTGKTDEAILHYQASLQLNAKNDSAHINIGNALARKGLLDEAISHYDFALDINPNNFKGHINLGNALAQKREYKKAVWQYYKALKIEPDSAEAHKNLGKMLLIQGRLNEAERHFKKALEIIPKDPKGYNSLNRLLAIIYTFKKEYDLAISSFQKIIALQPDNPLPYYNIACIYSRQNKKTKATDWLRAAVKHGYDNWKYLKADPDLQNIRNTAYYQNLIKHKNSNVH